MKPLLVADKAAGGRRQHCGIVSTATWHQRGSMGAREGGAHFLKSQASDTFNVKHNRNHLYYSTVRATSGEGARPNGKAEGAGGGGGGRELEFLSA